MYKISLKFKQIFQMCKNNKLIMSLIIKKLENKNKNHNKLISILLLRSKKLMKK